MRTLLTSLITIALLVAPAAQADELNGGVATSAYIKHAFGAAQRHQNGLGYGFRFDRVEAPPFSISITPTA
ncbi:hypothetical protein BOW53_09220 [Solemya pervernicosa gill symbiont]|uniref:Outer membrane protein beta-barrel domain-containing protein n=1 Tax=Solemya pervernicosa gill symbiont TaxID=642797 RepID=A0A1T2L4N4_9GAMM|nr:hypothetical protein [Solemya pervernicosa gill symbiont]OOZ40067.1 hypothetical protein BOW53_09220 [Solemya pervernicosa gill symbiont]